MKKSKSITINDLEPTKQPPQSNLTEALRALGLGERISSKDRSKSRKKSSKSIVTLEDMGQDKISQTKDKPKKKRQGVDTKPIFKSLETSNPDAEWGEDFIAIRVLGGRLLTYNELFSILQFRKHETFRYKKICRNVIERALNKKDTKPMPFFDGPTRLTLIRVGQKRMDRDALQIVFKYLVDALRHQGVIDDDNPDIIVDIATHQEQGEPYFALRLDRLSNWKEPATPSWDQLISN